MGGMLSPLPTSSFKGTGIDKLRAAIEQETLTSRNR